MGWTWSAGEVVGGVHERHVRECLRKVSEHLPADGVVLFGE